MRVVIMGPPGAGKGTQAQKLSQRFGTVHFSAGDLLREAMSHDSSLGRKAKPYISKGDLVPDSIVLKIIEGKIKKNKDGFILDGFPRNTGQAKKLDVYLSRQKKELDRVINLEVDEDTILRRLKGRLICPECGKIYSPESISPEVVCQSCGNRLRQRIDDSGDTVKNRIKVYLEHTLPLAKYYDGTGALRNVSGEGSPDEVFDRIVKLI